MKEYHKIKNIYCRNIETKELIEGAFIDETIKYLKDNIWEFTEKIDGTNIRIYWDGHNVQIGGRTDRAQIPAHLMERLSKLFLGEVNEQIFEQCFGEKEVIFFGEGYGYKIQNGGDYLEKNVDFIMFDVMINGNYQPRNVVDTLAMTFGVDSVPVLFEGELEEGVDYVKTFPKSTIGNAMMEGVVARPKVELLNRNGERVIVKIKCRDFDETKRQ